MTMVVIVCTLFFSWKSEALRDLLGVNNRFILLSEGNKWTVFDVDTCLGVGETMNYELSPFMTTTFPTVELCFHSGALHLNSSFKQSSIHWTHADIMSHQ